jgi:hypothetical protein
MSKKVNPVSYHLDPGNIKKLAFHEIKTIVRGADAMIMQGGRSLLAKLLKGSRDKKVTEHNMDKEPVYGAFKNKTIEEITSMIDWAILNGYVALEYDHRLPLFVHTPEGWEIARKIRVAEFLDIFDKMIISRLDYNMSFLKDRNRQMIFELLEEIRNKKDKKYVPLLKAWKKIDYKKVNDKINSVLQEIEGELYEN